MGSDTFTFVDSMGSSDFNIRVVEWGTEREAVRSVRQAVFVIEQNVPEEEEWDGLDPECVHVLAEGPDGMAIGTARMTAGGKLGRMAVRGDFRTRGVGTAMLEALVDLARNRGLRRVVLDAQVRALGFYEKRGFAAEGPVFMDAGIPHRWMTRDL